MARVRGEAPPAFDMTSSFIPPTLSQYDGSLSTTESPSQRSRLVLSGLPALTSVPAGEHFPETNRMSLLLSLPAIPTEVDDDGGRRDLHCIQAVSLAPPLLCAITAQAVYVYRVPSSLEIAPSTSSPLAARQKSVLLARWSVPPGIVVRAAVLAPNSSILAVLTSGASNTAALALLSPTTCKRRIRLALPPPLAEAVCATYAPSTKAEMDNDLLQQELLTFFSASNSTLASAPPPMEVIPPSLRKVFPLRVAPPQINEDPTPWAIAISANGSAFVQVFVFHRGYRRLHHQAFLSVPHVLSDSRLVFHSALELQTSKSLTILAATTKSSVFIAKGVSFDEVLAQSDVPITTLAAVTPDTNIFFCIRANGVFGLAVCAGSTLHVHSTYVQAADVRATRLVTLDARCAPALVVVLTRDGILHVVARVIIENENFPRIIPFDSPASLTHNLHANHWPCAPTAAAAISVHGSIVTAAFVSRDRIVVRFLDCTTILSDTGP